MAQQSFESRRSKTAAAVPGDARGRGACEKIPEQVGLSVFSRETETEAGKIPAETDVIALNPKAARRQILFSSWEIYVCSKGLQLLPEGHFI